MRSAASSSAGSWWGGEGLGAAVRVAAFQRLPAYDDVQLGAERLAADLDWADAQGVHLALFPEVHLGGHAYDRPTIERRSLQLDGEPMRRLLADVARFSPVAVVGLFERREDGVRNVAVVISRGRIVGSYAKAHPNEEGVIEGAAFPVFDAAPRPFGINICNDANHPGAAQAIADGGGAVLCYPLCNMLRPEVAEDWRERHVANLRGRARQTGCWVMSADVAGRREGRISYGCTAVLRPDGEVVARVPELEKGVVLCDLA